MTHETIGSRWSLTPSVDTTVSENNPTSTAALKDFVNSNRSGSSSVSLASEAFTCIFRSMSPSAIRLKKQKSCLSHIVLRKCLNNILDFRSCTRTVDSGAGTNIMALTGLIDLEKSTAYCRSQQQHHGVTVIDDRQQ